MIIFVSLTIVIIIIIVSASSTISSIIVVVTAVSSPEELLQWPHRISGTHAHLRSRLETTGSGDAIERHIVLGLMREKFHISTRSAIHTHL